MPREFWIDPESWTDEPDEATYDAYQEKPIQGPLQWQASLIHVREVNESPHPIPPYTIDDAGIVGPAETSDKVRTEVEERAKKAAQSYAPDGKYEFFKAYDFEQGYLAGYASRDAEFGAAVKELNGIALSALRERDTAQSKITEAEALIGRLGDAIEELYCGCGDMGHSGDCSRGVKINAISAIDDYRSKHGLE